MDRKHRSPVNDYRDKGGSPSNRRNHIRSRTRSKSPLNRHRSSPSHGNSYNRSPRRRRTRSRSPRSNTSRRRYSKDDERYSARRSRSIEDGKSKSNDGTKVKKPLYRGPDRNVRVDSNIQIMIHPKTGSSPVQSTSSPKRIITFRSSRGEEKTRDSSNDEHGHFASVLNNRDSESGRNTCNRITHGNGNTSRSTRYNSNHSNRGNNYERNSPNDRKSSRYEQARRNYSSPESRTQETRNNAGRKYQHDNDESRTERRERSGRRNSSGCEKSYSDGANSHPSSRKDVTGRKSSERRYRSRSSERRRGSDHRSYSTHNEGYNCTNTSKDRKVSQNEDEDHSNPTLTQGDNIVPEMPSVPMLPRVVPRPAMFPIAPVPFIPPPARFLFPRPFPFPPRPRLHFVNSPEGFSIFSRMSAQLMI